MYYDKETKEFVVDGIRWPTRFYHEKDYTIANTNTYYERRTSVLGVSIIWGSSTYSDNYLVGGLNEGPFTDTPAAVEAWFPGDEDPSGYVNATNLNVKLFEIISKWPEQKVESDES